MPRTAQTAKSEDRAIPNPSSPSHRDGPLRRQGSAASSTRAAAQRAANAGKKRSIPNSFLAVPSGRPPSGRTGSAAIEPAPTGQPPQIAAKEPVADLAETPPQATACKDALCRALARPCRAGRKILNLAVFRRFCDFGRRAKRRRAPRNKRTQNAVFRLRITRHAQGLVSLLGCPRQSFSRFAVLSTQPLSRSAAQPPQLAAHRTHSKECLPAPAGREGRF